MVNIARWTDEPRDFQASLLADFSIQYRAADCCDVAIEGAQ
jgi:hypothetical protein